MFDKMMDATSSQLQVRTGRSDHQTALEPEAMSEENAGERILVKRAQSGEHGAFNELVNKYRQRVMKVSIRYTGNQADAEDAVQNTFLKAYRAITRFRGECAFYSWLHRIAINSAKTTCSLRRRHEDLFKSLSPYADDVHERAQAPKEWDTPEALIITDEICEAVNAAVESLSEEQRVAIVLRELDGLNYSEIASSMVCPVGTVRSRVFRAREAIDTQLRRVFSDGLGRVKASPRRFA